MWQFSVLCWQRLGEQPMIFWGGLRKRWLWVITEYVRTRQIRNAYTKFCLGSLRGRYHSEDLGVNGRIILKLMWRKYGCTKSFKSRLNSENDCYHSVQSLLSSRLLSRKVKVKNVQNHNSASCVVWVRNLVSHIKGRASTEGVREQCTEVDIWAKEEWSLRRMEEVTQWGAS
jgi:hypothetical protein